MLAPFSALHCAYRHATQQALLGAHERAFAYCGLARTASGDGFAAWLLLGRYEREATVNQSGLSGVFTPIQRRAISVKRSLDFFVHS
jgi:hypothetical protein